MVSIGKFQFIRKSRVVIPKNLENTLLFFESYYGTYGSKNTTTSLPLLAQKQQTSFTKLIFK
jgi:hypothetical protein